MVEGCYDAARLANLVEGTILTTDGFAVFKDKRMQSLLKRTARAQGPVSSSPIRMRPASRSAISSPALWGARYVRQAYIPALAGKERRKRIPGKEGLLGVEGVPDAVILQALEQALQGAPRRESRADRPAPHHLHRPV